MNLSKDIEFLTIRLIVNTSLAFHKMRITSSHRMSYKNNRSVFFNSFMLVRQLKVFGCISYNTSVGPYTLRQTMVIYP